MMPLIRPPDRRANAPPHILASAIVYKTMSTKRPFEQIVIQHGPTVLRVCRALLARSDADDAWSETFLAALRAYPSLHPDANVQAWLVTIAHRKAIDALRAEARRPLPVPEPPEPASLPPDEGTDDDRLWAGWRALTDKQRQAVALHHIAGLPYAEVADRLGGTAAAARRAAADGIAALRRAHPTKTTTTLEPHS
jgi:RNA polymerase sigma factor (sigma-70 family)